MRAILITTAMLGTAAGIATIAEMRDDVVRIDAIQVPSASTDAGSESGDSSEPSTDRTEPLTAADLPHLCDLNPRWCTGCGDATGCPQGNSGPLCCSGNLCVEWDGTDCPGLVGWCFNYTTSVDPETGIKKAECHD